MRSTAKRDAVDKLLAAADNADSCAAFERDCSFPISAAHYDGQAKAYRAAAEMLGGNTGALYTALLLNL